MSDVSVAQALRSSARLVVVEAPAGCGKTYQAAEYARWFAMTTEEAGKILILTHTHAACDVFRGRTSDVARRVTVSTIDGLISQVAGMYHLTLGLPKDVSAWARNTTDGFETLALKVGNLLTTSKTIAKALAYRHPVIVCDEHQDANPAQHQVVMAVYAAGANLRVFGDPMQSIYGAGADQEQQWSDLMTRADCYEELDFPHRWTGGSEELGRWVLRARATLKARSPVDLRTNLPVGLEIILADNHAPRHGNYQMGEGERGPLDQIIRRSPTILILCSHKLTIRGLFAFWSRRIPVWEGHTRDALSQLMVACQRHNGNPRELAIAMVAFLKSVGIGFSPSGFSDRLLVEIAGGCIGNMNGKPGHLRSIGRHLLQSPNHVGVARALALIKELSQNEPLFSAIKIDMKREYIDAVRLADYDDLDHGFAEITRKRVGVQATMAAKTLSTVHKAKGLENSHVVVLPCDDTHFSATDKNRCLLYVALSRATTSLTLVVSPTRCTPLLIF